jgi:hypothetical protein
MEKQVYRSKVSKGLVAFIAIIIIGVLLTMIFAKVWPGIIIDVLIFVFFAYLFNSTYYVILGDTLKVRSGFIINITVDISTITKIVPTDSMLSAPALSFDRLEVFYNKYDSVVISPGDKAGFIATLKEINPEIEVKSA